MLPRIIFIISVLLNILSYSNIILADCLNITTKKSQMKNSIGNIVTKKQNFNLQLKDQTIQKQTIYIDFSTNLSNLTINQLSNISDSKFEEQKFNIQMNNKNVKNNNNQSIKIFSQKQTREKDLALIIQFNNSQLGQVDLNGLTQYYISNKSHPYRMLPTYTTIQCANMYRACANCTSTQCTLCFYNLLPTNHICCYYNQYYWLPTNSCISCASLFVNCSICTTQQCNICFSPYVLSNGRCCQSTAYYNTFSSSCNTCQSKFLNCTSCTSIACIACATGYQLISGYCCLTNYFYDTVALSCIACQPKYGYCTTCNQNSCLNCATNYQIASGYCCLTTQFYDTSASSCISCSPRFGSCTTCNSSACLICTINYQNDMGHCCLQNQFYAALTNQCIVCSTKYANCITCNSNLCSACSTSTIFHIGVCCETSIQFFNSQTISCDSCSSKFAHCATCTSNACLTCSNSTLFSGLCCTQSEYYKISSLSCSICNLKYSNCYSCNSTTCLSCITGNITSGLCCSINEYFDYKQRICKLCSQIYPHCLTCNALQCLTCPFLYPLNGTQCSACQYNQYIAKNGFQCLQCPLNCILCINNICKKCEQNYTLILNSCLYSSTLQNPQISIANVIFDKNSVAGVLLQNLNQFSAIKYLLNSIFQMFILIDDLWLMAYHQTNYRLTIANIFQSIRQTENGKFNSFSGIQQVDNLVNKVTSRFDKFMAFGKQKFVTIQNSSSGFFANMNQFFIFAMIQTFITFILLRYIFYRLLFKYKISRILRQFTFNCCFAFALLDGNIQYFNYVSLNQLQQFFNFDSIDKIFNIAFIVLFFMITIGPIVLILLLKYHLKLMSRYFMENQKPLNSGFIMMMVRVVIRNLSIAFVTSVLSRQYYTMIICLNLIEVLYIAGWIVSFVTYKCFADNIKFWSILLFSFMRFILQTSFVIFTNQQDTSIQYAFSQNIQVTVCIIYALFWVFTIMYFIGKKIFQNIQSFTKRKQMLTVSQSRTVQISTRQISKANNAKCSSKDIRVENITSGVKNQTIRKKIVIKNHPLLRRNKMIMAKRLANGVLNITVNNSRSESVQFDQTIQDKISDNIIEKLNITESLKVPFQKSTQIVRILQSQ